MIMLFINYIVKLENVVIYNVILELELFVFLDVDLLDSVFEIYLFIVWSYV